MLPLDDIRAALFAKEQFATKVRKDYGIATDLNGAELEEAVYQSLGQEPRAQGAPIPTNREVFRAAVRALASNSRSWSLVHGNEAAIQEACHGFDPEKVIADPANAGATIRRLIPGLTSGKDAQAIVEWARILSRTPRYGEYLEALAGRCHALPMMTVRCTEAVTTALVAVIAGLDLDADGGLAKHYGVPRKFPGMRAVLGSEFLRNLGWQGFKPDRHVIRLLDLWTTTRPEWAVAVEQAKRDGAALADGLGCRDRDARQFLYYSRLGEILTPEGIPVTRADQLVWLYGSIVEKKPRQPR